mmetsp:Transcript_27143/g.72897  ORF Transcript_27143/g.72897 Transcript_27143/m.72897 type:complete len:281 (-) Transcript_27143:143-985(-)
MRGGADAHEAGIDGDGKEDMHAPVIVRRLRDGVVLADRPVRLAVDAHLDLNPLDVLAVAGVEIATPLRPLPGVAGIAALQDDADDRAESGQHDSQPLLVVAGAPGRCRVELRLVVPSAAGDVALPRVALPGRYVLAEGGALRGGLLVGGQVQCDVERCADRRGAVEHARKHVLHHAQQLHVLEEEGHLRQLRRGPDVETLAARAPAGRERLSHPRAEVVDQVECDARARLAEGDVRFTRPDILDHVAEGAAFEGGDVRHDERRPGGAHSEDGLIYCRDIL